jgi:alpha-beta hydrolase superfamily lysophospholipase
LNAEWLGSIRVPVLALVAGDERVVFAPATDYGLSLMPHVERYHFEDARHELLHELPETTEKIWEHISAFLTKTCASYGNKFDISTDPLMPLSR